MPANRPGSTIGTVIRRKTVHRDAPSVAAAASYSRLDARRAPSALMRKNGRATNVCARTTAKGVNGEVTPNISDSGLPEEPPPPEPRQEGDASHHGWHQERDSDQRSDRGPAGHLRARQRPRQRQPEEHAQHGRRARGDERQPQRSTRGRVSKEIRKT